MTTMFVAIHAIAASGVVLLAPVQLIRRTKDRKHRFIGRSWVLLMYFVCVSGMFIYSLSGSFTVFHALAIFTFLTTTTGVIAIRKGNIRLHVGMMVGSWLGALTAGTFAAIIPSRDIPRLAASDPFLLWAIIVGIIVAATVWVGYVLLFVPTARLKATGQGSTGAAVLSDEHMTGPTETGPIVTGSTETGLTVTGPTESDRPSSSPAGIAAV